MKAARRTRWAISFADLCLLLLGFFVLLQAQAERERNRALASLNGYFRGGAGMQSARFDADIPATSLFVAQEAILTDAGHRRLVELARRIRSDHAAVRISSRGMEAVVSGSTARFDGWDLAAARVGALARALIAAGVDPRAIRISGPDSGSSDRTNGQFLLIRSESWPSQRPD